MNVFVTGGAGYIGSVCVEELCEAGHTVTVLDNLSEGHRSAVDPRARFVQADLADGEAVKRAVKESGATAVVHFAASALVGESMSDPSKYFRNNVLGGLNLADAAVAAGVKKFVFSSTCATYGEPERVPLDELLPQRPVNPYGESKLMFERVLHWYRQIHGLEVVGFRYFNAAGASRRFGEHHRVETHLIPNVLRVALGQKSHVEIFGTDYPTPDGTCIRDYIHVEDLIDAHVKVLGILQPGDTRTYNLGMGRGYSVREMMNAARKVTGRDFRVIEGPRRQGDPPRLFADPSKIKRELGWSASITDLNEIIRSAWNWFEKHPNGYTS